MRGEMMETSETADVAGTAMREAGAAPLLEVRGLSMRYPTAGPGSGSGALIVLRDVALAVAAGELAALVGPSGCGKSTLLALIAGLETPASGTIALHGDPDARRLGRVGYMPQRDLLLPWRTALGNAAAGLEVRGVARGEARERARALFADFGLAGFENAYPAALSGGMRQRVAFARTALVAGELLLLDEPFGALDALTRAGLQEWLLDVWARLQLGAACVLVTHDVDEALLLADRVYVLSARPGTVRLERRVPLPRPRRLEMLARPEIAALKAELLAALVDDQSGGAQRRAAAGGAP